MSLPTAQIPPIRTNISSDYAAYDCPVTGQMIEGRAAHRENLKKHGCRLLEKGEKEQSVKTRKRETEAAIRQSTGEMMQRLHQQF